MNTGFSIISCGVASTVSIVPEVSEVPIKEAQ